MRHFITKISVALASATMLASASFAQTPLRGGSQAQAPAAQGAKPAAPAAPAASPAPVSNDPETTTSTYGDWLLRCQRVQDANGSRRNCEVAQAVSVKGQNAPIAQIAFGRINANDPLRVTVVTPHDVSFPSTIRIAMDEKDTQPTELAWTRCLPVGCFASGGPSADALKKWRASSESGRLIVRSGGGQDVAILFSFRGLAQALDALAKEK